MGAGPRIRCGGLRRGSAVGVVGACVALLLLSCTTDLGTVSGGNNSAAADINERGDVVGTSTIGADQNETHGFLKPVDQPMKDLGEGEARAINDNGVSVGVLGDPGQPGHHAVRWDPQGAAHGLGAGADSIGVDINNSGVIVGTRPVEGGYGGWIRDPRTGAVTDLPGSLPGGLLPHALSDNGAIVGHQYDGTSHAVFWASASQPAVLLSGAFGFTATVAEDINDDGTIVGWGYGPGGSGAILWKAGTHEPIRVGPTSLPNPGPDDPGPSIALGINDPGQVVGFTYFNYGYEQRAFLWEPATGRTTFLPGLGGDGPEGSQAAEVNNAGVSVGSSRSHAVRYDPPG